MKQLSIVLAIFALASTPAWATKKQEPSVPSPTAVATSAAVAGALSVAAPVQHLVNNVEGSTVTSSSVSEGSYSNSGGNTTTSSIQYPDRFPVSTAIAPALTATNGTCMGSTSAGGQGVTFGISFGTTWTDSGCDARYDAIAMDALGLKAAAIQRLCAKPEIKEAMEATGMVCKQPPKTATAENVYVN